MPKEEFTRETVQPSDFETEKYFMESPFQNFEQEMIARNIVIICQRNGNYWIDFSWEGYQLHCNHKVTDKEKDILDGFVSKGLLSLCEDIYTVQNSFIQLLSKFIKDA